MAPPPQHRSKGRNLTFAFVVFVLTAGLGLAWAWQGQTVHIAETEVEVGVRFGGGPLEPAAVAGLRLQGKLRAQPKVHAVRVTPLSGPGPGQILHIWLSAETATAAQSAMQKGLREVLAGYVRWQDEDVAIEQEAQGALGTMQARLNEALNAGRNAGYAKAALQESAEHLNGVHRSLQALALTPPAVLKPVALHTETENLDSSKAVAGLLMAIALAAVAGMSGWGRGGAVWVCGATMLASLHQAESAPPGFEATSHLRLARLKGEPVLTHPPARPKLLSWVAARVRRGHLPNGVIFDLRSISDQSLGLYELRGVGEDPAELIEIVGAATFKMSHWNDQGLDKERKELWDRQNGQRIHSQKLLAQDAFKAHRRFAQMVLDRADSRRASNPIRSDVTEVLMAPQSSPLAHGGRYVLYLSVGFVSGLLVLILFSQLRRRKLS